MTLEYDLDARALYITLAEGQAASTRTVDDNTMLDLDGDGQLTGIEVVSIDYPWDLGKILSDFPVGDRDAAMLRAYFRPDEDGMARAEAPVMSVAVPR